MIPNRAQCLLLFDRFNLPSNKRIHVEEVTRLALFFGESLQKKGIAIDMHLLEAAGLLHDIDKNISKREGERHPDTAVRILKELGYGEVALVVARHSLHHILNAQTTPQSWEEKLIYLADKMTKYEIIGVDHRFKLWYAENLPSQAQDELDQSLPKVKSLEEEVYKAAGITYLDVQNKFKRGKSSR